MHKILASSPVHDVPISFVDIVVSRDYSALLRAQRSVFLLFNFINIYLFI